MTSRHLRLIAGLGLVVLVCTGLLYGLLRTTDSPSFLHSLGLVKTHYSRPSSPEDPDNPTLLPLPHKLGHHSQTSSNVGSIRQTTLVAPAVMGFTGFDRLYLRNGTYYVVTDEPDTFPPRKEMISPPKDIDGPVGEDETTDRDLQFITPERAREVLGKDGIVELEGLNVIVTDTPQFIWHYYHWWGEFILGVWRVHAASGFRRGIAPDDLELPRRFFLPLIDEDVWPPSPYLVGTLMRAAFPNAPMESSRLWKDLNSLKSTVVFERAILVNRASAHRHPKYEHFMKMLVSAMEVPVPAEFWEPIRESVVRHIVGYLPILADGSTTTATNATIDTYGDDDGEDDLRVRTTRLRRRRQRTKRPVPVVTYISRQSTSRRLLDEHHKALVKALAGLENEGVCEFVLAKMEDMSLAEQVEVAASSTIMVGVHGNGLTHQLWMPKSPHSSIFEILVPQGYAFDYEFLARNMGHRHYAVWNDTFKTYPPGTLHLGVHVPDGFHGSEIIVDGPALANAIRARLLEPAILS